MLPIELQIGGWHSRPGGAKKKLSLAKYVARGAIKSKGLVPMCLVERFWKNCGKEHCQKIECTAKTVTSETYTYTQLGSPLLKTQTYFTEWVGSANWQKKGVLRQRLKPKPMKSFHCGQTDVSPYCWETSEVGFLLLQAKRNTLPQNEATIASINAWHKYAGAKPCTIAWFPNLNFKNRHAS